MIRKYLVCGKRQVYIQSKNIDAYAEVGKVVELLMPITDFWALEKQIKKIDYLNASNAPSVEVGSLYRKVLVGCSKFAVFEIDRNWLHEHKTKEAG